MGLRVNTNIASLTAQRNLFEVTSRLQGNYARLSSGLRIAIAADDAAGLGISERMRSQIRSLTVAARNAQDGISLSQTAEGALNEVSNILGRMRELSMQSANGTLTDAEDRVIIEAEFDALATEIDRVAGSANFNGVNLLDAVGTLAIQVGLNSGDTVDVNTVDATVAGLNGGAAFTGADTAVNAGTTLAEIDGAINLLNAARGGLGAAQNRMTSALTSIYSQRDNLSAAESRIRDVDVASETADLTRNSIMQQAATSILQQANVQPQVALALLQG
jgi:flagellin